MFLLQEVKVCFSIRQKTDMWRYLQTQAPAWCPREVPALSSELLHARLSSLLLGTMSPSAQAAPHCHALLAF